MKTPTAHDANGRPLPEYKKYFDVCREKLGMVPNILQAYAFDIDKLNAFTTFYNDLMLGNSSEQVRARNDCGGRFINQSLFLL